MMLDAISPNGNPSVRHLSDSLITEEAQWFCAVHALLGTIFVRSRRVHNMYFHDSISLDRDALLENDEGGSALLTEMQGYLGREVLLRKAFFKRLVLLCAHGLRWPLRRVSSGIFAIGFKPRFREHHDAVAKTAISRLPLPSELIQLHLLPLLGDSWWGVQSACDVSRSNNEQRFAIKLLPPPRKMFKRIFPFQHTHVFFSAKEPALLEWEGGDSSSLIIRTRNIWNLMNLIRYMRRKQRCRSEIVHVDGLGDVLL